MQKYWLTQRCVIYLQITKCETENLQLLLLSLRLGLERPHKPHLYLHTTMLQDNILCLWSLIMLSKIWKIWWIKLKFGQTKTDALFLLI